MLQAVEERGREGRGRGILDTGERLSRLRSKWNPSRTSKGRDEYKDEHGKGEGAYEEVEGRWGWR